MPEFKPGDRVKKEGGDYIFSGVVLSAFEKMRVERDRWVPSGVWRYAVQNQAGMIHIFNEKQLTRRYADI